MIIDTAILVAIDSLAPTVRIPQGCLIEPRALLAALTGNESNWGTDCAPRDEKGYYVGGYYYENPGNGWLRMLVKKYGRCAASSWGPWQIMYPVAYELGYRGGGFAHPWGLYEPDQCLHWVVEYLNRRVFRFWPSAPKPALMAPAMTIQQVGDGYNTGNFRDDHHNPKYESDLAQHYAEAAALYAQVKRPPPVTT